MFRSAFVAIVSCLLLAAALPAAASAALQLEVDPRYGTAGRSVGRMHFPSTGDHHFVVSRTAVRRYLPSGAVDTSFAGDGELRFGAEPDRDGHAIVDSSGRIVVLARRELRRYQPDGRGLDRTFGSDGVVSLDELPVARDGIAYRAVLAAADGIVLLLYRPGAPLLVRLAPDGTLETTFGSKGTLELDELGSAHLLTALPDGRMVVGGSARLVLVDAQGVRVGSGASTSAYPGAVTPLPDGGYAWVANSSVEIGTQSSAETVVSVAIGIVGPDGAPITSRKTVYSNYYEAARFTALARMPGGGFIAAGTTSSEHPVLEVMRISADLRPVRVACCGGRRGSTTRVVRPGIPLDYDTIVRVVRATAHSFDVIVRTPAQRGRNDQAARLRFRWKPARTLRPPTVTARWPRTRFWFPARLSVSWTIRSGERPVASIDATNYSFPVGPAIHPSRRRGIVRFPVEPGSHCFYLSVVDVLNDHATTRLCLERPDLPTTFDVLRGCVQLTDRAAYLGRAVRCLRTGSLLSNYLTEDGQVTVVLRECPGCGSARVTVTGDDLRAVRNVNLEAPRRGRRVVPFENLGGPAHGGADRVTIAVTEGGTQGVTLEGLDAS